MIFTETKLQGAVLIDIEKREDNRGFFARSWCQQEFHAHGITSRFVQGNVSWNKKRGTLRGMHWQMAPHEECKLIRCTRGGIYAVVLDVRRSSLTFAQWIAFELSEKTRRSVFVAGGFAVGFLTLRHSTEVEYLMSEFYTPDCARGIRYNDPAFGITWPIPVEVISEKDASWPDYERISHVINAETN